MTKPLRSDRATIDRLKALLARIQWSSSRAYNGGQPPACPSCGNWKDEHLSVMADAKGKHRPDCELARELA